MTVPVVTVTPAGAAGAYARVQNGIGPGEEAGPATPGFGVSPIAPSAPRSR